MTVTDAEWRILNDRLDRVKCDHTYLVTVRYEGHVQPLLETLVKATNCWAALLRAFESSTNRTVTLDPAPKEQP
jgi:hypothetical protein